jgi:metal-responsive CopG/Arc/MetJ family transcriptional regulator
MKTIQVTMDEKLLEKLDRDQETQRDGRSAVLRRAVAEYLKRRLRRDVSSAYRRAYSERSGLGPDFEAWEEEGVWPTE